MPTARSLRIWAWLHKWSSLVCTVFMLLLCLTGLPLIFHHEIGHLLGTEPEPPEMPADTRHVGVDRVLETARALHPGLKVLYISQEPDDDRFWYVNLGPDAAGPITEAVTVDARTAAVLPQPRFDEGFMHVMFKLHVDLFAGLPGTLFLGFMGLLLLVALVSGVMLYAPFMRKLRFGDVRRDRAPRLKWLDLHNLLGIVTLAWAFVVGATGVINTLADPIVDVWQADQMAEMTAPYRGLPPPASLGSMQASLDAALASRPGMKLAFVAFPGTAFSSPHHYGIYLRGNEPLTFRLYRPVLVDAATTAVTDSRVLPWYVTGLLLSQPLHFGDYGGLPMQILWALLDVLTIVVLGSGLYLWLKRGRRPVEEQLATLGVAPAEAAALAARPIYERQEG